MALQSQTQVYIGNKRIDSFKQFILDQDINAHHLLTLECRTDVLEELKGELSNVTKNYLGKRLTIQVASLSEFSAYKELEFRGVVTSVTTTKGYNNEHLVTITAESPTILCDDGPHYDSHLDKTLASIINETLSGYDSSFKFDVKPENRSSIHYSVQHKESNWNYLSRLAKQYSEWFYYDGKKLVFGKAEEKEDVILTYGQDLQGFSLDLIPLPNNFKYFTNDYLTNEQHEKKTSEVQTGINGYNGFVSERGKSLYAKETSIWINGYNDPTLKERMDKQVEQQTKVLEQKQVRVKGDSDNPGVSIGKIINIQDDSGSHGRYKVIKIKHINNENGKYHNSFTAVCADIDVFPDTDFEAFPKSDTQTAVVYENTDPNGIARIQVQFPWQKPTGSTTPFIRVVTPHGGGDKGFHFIPEIGEEVLIGFEGGNAERPYMMGSLYNGSATAKSFKSNANDVKALKTRSGHIIELNDTNGSEFITIKDKNENLINIDTATNNITITALETMTLNSKNMEINVDENLDINVGKNKTEQISKAHTINTSTSVEYASQTKSVNVNLAYMQSAGSNSLISVAGDLTMHAKGVSTLQGNADVKISKG